MKEKSLVVFDFDGTLSRGETICDVLAKTLSRLPRMKEIERLESKEDIAVAREEMVTWYDDMSDSDIEKSLQGVNLAPGLESGFSKLRDYGVTIAIASITWRFAIEHFARRWNIEHFIATDILPTGEIEHVWAEHKAHFIHRLASRLGIPLERVAAVGDSSGDYDMLQLAGIPIFVGEDNQPNQHDWLCLPNANISEIAEHLIKVWCLKPNNHLQVDTKTSYT